MFLPAQTEKQDRHSLHQQGMGFLLGTSRVAVDPQCRSGGHCTTSSHSAANFSSGERQEPKSFFLIMACDLAAGSYVYLAASSRQVEILTLNQW